MSRVSSQAGDASHSVLTQRRPLVMPRSVRKASAYRSSTCIDGAARKNDHRRMLHESDIPPHMDHPCTPTHAQSQTLEWRARPDAYCVNAWLRSSTCTASAIRARLCHAAPSRHAMAQPVRAEQASVCQPSLTCSPSERSLRSSAPTSPKAEAVAAGALAARSICAEPPRPTARTRASLASPEGARSNMRVNVRS
jgi:hypothetical protein